MVVRVGARGRWVAAAVVGIVLLVAVGLVVALRGNDGGTGSGRAAGSSTSSGPSSVPSSAPPATSSAPAPTTPAPSPSTSPGVPPALVGEDVTRVPTDRPVVALTFDAGGDAAGLPAILRTLAASGVPATFFLTGRFAADHPDLVAAIGAGGHRVGNHSVTHPHFPALSDAAIGEEVRGAEQAIRAAGADPRPLFRFPFGDRDARTIAAVNALGYVAVRWTVDSLGWQGTSGGQSAGSVADRALAGLQPGEIVLMHVGANPDDGSTLDADALPDVIARMRAAGYDFVTLDALLATSAG